MEAVVLFVKMILGHFVADYPLQPEKMALMKGQKGWKGLTWCVIHCLIYTFTVCLFSWRWDLPFAVCVFLSHFVIDRWSLASKWLNLVKGRDFMRVYTEKPEYWEIALSFSTLVYERTDMTLHFVQMWGIANWV